MTTSASEQVHATCIVFAGCGILIRGQSGSGKSDLALRLIDQGGTLVADDRVDLTVRNGELTARSPDAIRGRMEVRGIGIVEMPVRDEITLRVVVDLAPRSEVERMPEPNEFTTHLCGVMLTRIKLDPFDASATAKVRLAIRIASGK